MLPVRAGSINTAGLLDYRMIGQVFATGDPLIDQSHQIAEVIRTERGIAWCLARGIGAVGRGCGFGAGLRRACRYCVLHLDGVGGGIIIGGANRRAAGRSAEHTSELQSLMRISYAVFCLKK